MVEQSRPRWFELEGCCARLGRVLESRRPFSVRGVRAALAQMRCVPAGDAGLLPGGGTGRAGQVP